MANIIARHPLSANLSESAGFIVQTVSGKKDAYEGFRSVVPEITWDAVTELAATSESLRRYVLNHLEASQRQLMRKIEQNGQTQTDDAIALPAIIAFESTAGAAAVRVTKELIADMAPLFRKAIAAMYAEARGIADKMAESEIFAASAATQQFYLSQLDALRGSAVPSLDVLRGTRKAMDLTVTLAADVGTAEKVRYAVSAVSAKLDVAIAEAEKVGDLVQMF